MNQHQPLDLSISLTTPPQDSLSEAIAALDIRCDALGLIHTGDQFNDPLKPQERDELQWYLEEYWKWPYEGFAVRGRNAEKLLIEVGRRLYSAVFGSMEARDIVQAWRLHSSTERQISIISNIPKVLSLPWELLHDEQGFFVLRTRHPVSIVRRLPLSQLAAFPVSFVLPLRILLVTARPQGTGFVNPRSIAHQLLNEVQSQIEAGAIELEFLRPPTLSALRHRLGDSKRPAVHLLHFDGHGTFALNELPQDGLRLSGGGQGMLAFEDDEGKLDLVKAEDVAQVLQHSGVRLAVITACQSAMSASDDAFSSIAARLIRGGLDAVVAMSASVLVVSAARYVEAFYRALSNGIPVPIAHERARQDLYDNPRRHIHRRHRAEKGELVELRDWWLPHFYQQRPLEPNQLIRRRKKQRPGNLMPRLSESMPKAPRYGFSGRAYELLQLERHLLRRKLVIIHGFGGVGKTAFAREAADWLTRTRMYSRACFVSFEHGGDATTLLSALGHFLEIHDGYYDPNDTAAALARLGSVLKNQPILISADNIESILPTGEVPLEIARRTQLWDVLLALVNLGAGMILTSRGVAFGDDRLAPGRQVLHLTLEGLQPEDAYELASNILVDLDIDRSRVPYTELRDLLKQLDYHPLAIQLVLPALQKRAITTIQSDFTALLPTFTDDKITGHNRSLLASLEYSLQQLSKEQQILLPRLALFEGGAFEYNLLEITQISEDEWINLRMSLEQSALLTEEPVLALWNRGMRISPTEGRMFTQTTEAFRNRTSVPFLHFHPVLVPYLRNLYDISDDQLRTRYSLLYCLMAHSWTYFPGLKQVQSAMWRELPNMRHAMELLLVDGQPDIAVDLVDSLTRFLYDFGLTRESDALWKRFNEITESTNTELDETLTRAEFLRESALIRGELAKGNIRSALDRGMTLLKRIEALPEGSSLGPGSLDHAGTLGLLAGSLVNDQSKAAEEWARKALTISSTLLKQIAERGGEYQAEYYREAINLHTILLNSLGGALMNQGQYAEAEEMLESGLKLYKSTYVGDLIKSSLATLAFFQGDSTTAQKRSTELLDSTDDPYVKASIWFNLGVIAQDQNEWSRAEDYYRESLALYEQIDDTGGITRVCEALAAVAQQEGRHEEAEIWHQRSHIIRPAD
jgi:tetratricopeptide (TPR) repeat protein